MSEFIIKSEWDTKNGWVCMNCGKINSWSKKVCERCGQEYKRDYEKEIIVMPNVCRSCDIFLSNSSVKEK